MAGRPREFDRDQALERAMLAFWRRGYEGTSMADLVQALGIASARIYAAFGSKQDLFREAVQRYEAGDGGFADRAMAQEPRVRDALARVLRDAVATYTDDAHPLGCMVVTAATNCAEENEAVAAWLTEHRRQRTQSLIDRLQRALDEGELRAGTDVQALGDFYATQLHGISVQARDGVPRQRLLAAVQTALLLLDTALTSAGKAD
ncbi:TetR/AcrR family transcriptional regulator [Delftia tsuruhatensis]|uniref:TetR/AcrR family transcriptional regulator n=2 Tax=Delftia TaxID=80865 RepID=A0A7T2YVC9_9BURK|nr:MULTISPECIES: TetR/AcrR family transcriptional regulator [Delftia]KAA9173419.1 TetR/AcrR family transcriptional regulator [Delftia sp. BR1]MPT04283.1 TetR/AcrR family transcriptional regulator [Delftia sp.]PZP74328.1 MAG: TetR/AcrR family transcriptional regulator [Delftia acidovorans]MCX7506652.1 TetR/AcrR family transcriptional regulator [Delftia tsuruhatensis]MDH0777026.1 TetR/AcrR family transcriptional regulator [Delftia tsuruhatensis]